MRYTNGLSIIEYPLVFENTRERTKRRNIGFNFPILISIVDSQMKNIVDTHQSFKDGGFSGLPMHYYIDKDANIYKGRPTTFQNGYAEHNYISLDEYIKNSIMISVERPRSNAASTEAITKLCAYICLTEYLYPMSDIYSLSDFFCISNNAEFYDVNSVRENVMKELFPDFDRNYALLNENNYSVIIIPDEDKKYRTIYNISKVLAMSSDFDKWFRVANLIRRANPEVVSYLRKNNPDKSEEEILFAPIEVSTILLAPPSPFENIKKSIVHNRRISTGYEHIVNTYAEAAKDISDEIKKNIE